MKIIIIGISLFFISLAVNAQNYKGDIDHVDPYWGVSKYFDPNTVDFSETYFHIRSYFYTKKNKSKEITEQIKNLNASNIWTKHKNDFSQNGIIGLNYQRIQIHISKVMKDSLDPFVYLVQGKSRVKQNICEFKGQIKIIKAFSTSANSDSGTLYASYIFQEDSNQTHSGLFNGILESSFYIEGKNLYLDESDDISDGYFNNTFVGTWTEYKSGKKKKCIWGDDRLPFTFDFDMGAGEIIVNEKYVKNGWESFNYDNEYIYDNKTQTATQKDKWWKNK
jgi:hypothetical protein